MLSSLVIMNRSALLNIINKSGEFCTLQNDIIFSKTLQYLNLHNLSLNSQNQNIKYNTISNIINFTKKPYINSNLLFKIHNFDVSLKLKEEIYNGLIEKKLSPHTHYLINESNLNIQKTKKGIIQDKNKDQNNITINKITTNSMYLGNTELIKELLNLSLDTELKNLIEEQLYISLKPYIQSKEEQQEPIRIYDNEENIFDLDIKLQTKEQLVIHNDEEYLNYRCS